MVVFLYIILVQQLYEIVTMVFVSLFYLGKLFSLTLCYQLIILFNNRKLL